MAKKKTETPKTKKEKTTKGKAEAEETKAETMVENPEEEPKEDETPAPQETPEENPMDNPGEEQEEQENDESTKGKAEAEETKAETPKPASPKVEAVEKDIPKEILGILKAFDDMEYLYIGKGGGIFRNGTPECVRGKAVLYKNPYFKNEKTEQ
ncbi:MAG: hypothetical protein K5920_09580 [Bacteroidales bacterium]|nr:hypothetical protein [Bacteroidales bacterium]